MIKLDWALLRHLGLSAVPDSDGALLLSTMQEVLTSRVGSTLAARLTHHDLTMFNAAIEQGRAEPQELLEDLVPDHLDVVREQFEMLCREIREHSASILKVCGVDQGDP